MRQVCSATEVPALSVTAPMLLTQVQREDISMKEWADQLKLDPGLCSRILHVANSPFFGVSRQIASVREAVVVLGLNQTRALVQVEVVRASLSAFPWQQFPLQAYWHRSLKMAASAQVLAGWAGLPEASAFTAGIFHNLGMLVMAQSHTADYFKLLCKTEHGQVLAELETEQFQFHHGQLGAELLSSWNFPLEICKAIAEQYDPEPERTSDILTTVLRAAQAMIVRPDWAALQHHCKPATLAAVGLNEASLPEIVQAIDSTYEAWIELAGAL